MTRRSEGRRRPGLRCGFTLLELLQVLLVTGIVLSIAAARIDWVSMEVNSAARQVGATLLAAQRLALLRQHGVVVAFDTAQRQLRLHEDRNNNGVVEAGETVKYVPLEDAVTFGRGSAPAHALGGKAVTFVKKQDGMPAVTFNRSGSASEMGGFYLTSRAHGTAAQAKHARAFDINRPTGRASLFVFDGTSWKRSF